MNTHPDFMEGVQKPGFVRALTVGWHHYLRGVDDVDVDEDGEEDVVDEGDVAAF